MIYRKFCRSCGDPFVTDNPYLKYCREWDCVLFGIVQKDPRSALVNAKLGEVTRSFGYRVVVDWRGHYILTPITDPEEPWREEQEDMIDTAHSRGNRMPRKRAWDIIAGIKRRQAGKKFLDPQWVINERRNQRSQGL